MVSDFRAGNKNCSTGIEIGRDAGPLRTVEAFIGDSVLTGGPDHDVVIIEGNLAVADCLFARGIKNPTGAIDRPSVLHHVIERIDRKSTRLNSSHVAISYAVFCLKIKNNY